jgi:succinate dehydrogenase / fumarate reductase cytochrome b subunit
MAVIAEAALRPVPLIALAVSGKTQPMSSQDQSPGRSQGHPRGRPLSPHLQVYRPQYTSMISIFHRITGVGLWAGTLLLVYWLVAAATGAEAYETARDLIGSFIGRLLLFGWTVALFYHLCNGIRHLFWDIGVGLELRDAFRSGMAVMAATVILTLATWIAAYSVMGGR